MNERDWVRQLIPELQLRLSVVDPTLHVEDGYKLTYASEIRSYDAEGPNQRGSLRYETDILVSEKYPDGSWIPRVVVEVKLKTINTHATIAYSQKASTHKSVHPYLRYGVLLAARKHYPLPGRLFRHGAHFDFMISWCALEPTAEEWEALTDVLGSEVVASRSLEEMIFNSRSRERSHYVVFHKPLVLK